MLVKSFEFSLLLRHKQGFSQNELDALLFYAFRYGLGRMTYAVEEIASIIINHLSVLSENHKNIMIKEIEKAISEDRAGMAIDKAIWVNLMDEININLAEDKTGWTQ